MTQATLFAGMMIGMVALMGLRLIVGKKSIYCASLIINIVVQILMSVAQNEKMEKPYLLITGTLWPSLVVFGPTYLLEFYPKSSH